MQFVIFISIYIFSVILLFFDVIVLDQTFASGDTFNPYAIHHILDQARQQLSEWPQWQPWIFSGMPSIEAFTYVNLLYLPSYLLDLIGVADLNIQFIHLIFSGVGMLLLVNKLISNKKISFIIGLLWMFNPFLITMIVYGHGSQMMTAAYLPWTLYFLHNLKSDQSIFNLLIFSLFFGFQLQRAHVQIAYYACMLLGSYFIFSFFKNRNKKYLLFFIAGCFVAFMLAAHIYLPSLDYRSVSIRSSAIGSFDYATNWSMHPKELITYVLPHFYGFGGSTYTGYMPFTDYPNYVGLMVLIIAFFSLKKFKNERVFFWIILLFSILLSFGKYFEDFYKIFYNYLPFFSSFRVPSMILIISNFCLYILCAFGLKDLLNIFKNKFSNINTELVMNIFLIISLMDIYRIDSQIIDPQPASGRQTQIISNYDFDRIFEEDETIIFLQENLGLNRIYPAGSIFTDPKFKYYGIESVGGYHPAKFGHYTDLMKNSNNLLSIPVMQMLNVKYIISPIEINHSMLKFLKSTAFNSVNGNMNVFIYSLKNSAPRAWFVRDVISEDNNIYNYLNANAFNPLKTAVVKDIESKRYQVGKVINTEWGMHEIMVEYESADSGILILSEIFYPSRWKAYIDNKEVKIFKANGVLRAVNVEAGNNKVIFKYDNSLFEILLKISNMFMVLISLYIFKPYLMSLLKNLR
jgi:hypothetical protein